MQQFKTFLMTIALGAVGLFMFVIGLAMTFFLFVVVAIASLFVKPASHARTKEQYKEQWQRRFRDGVNKKPSKNTSHANVIEGQYDILDI